MSERDYIFAKAERAFEEIEKAINPFKARKIARAQHQMNLTGAQHRLNVARSRVAAGDASAANAKAIRAQGVASAKSEAAHRARQMGRVSTLQPNSQLGMGSFGRVGYSASSPQRAARNWAD